MENNLNRSMCLYINMYIYIFLNKFAVHLKLTQYCKSTAAQFFFLNPSTINIFGPSRMACRILDPRPGTELTTSASGARSHNHWTPREVPTTNYLNLQMKTPEADSGKWVDYNPLLRRWVCSAWLWLCWTGFANLRPEPVVLHTDWAPPAGIILHLP